MFMLKLLISYLFFVALVFFVVAAVHGVRLYTDADLYWNDTYIPMWVSWLALLVSTSFGIKGMWFASFFLRNLEAHGLALKISKP